MPGRDLDFDRERNTQSAGPGPAAGAQVAWYLGKEAAAGRKTAALAKREGPGLGGASTDSDPAVGAATVRCNQPAGPAATAAVPFGAGSYSGSRLGQIGQPGRAGSQTAETPWQGPRARRCESLTRPRVAGSVRDGVGCCGVDLRATQISVSQPAAAVF